MIVGNEPIKLRTSRVIWITWENQRRSVELASALGAKLFLLAQSSSDIPNRALRYTWLSLKTLRAIWSASPRLVFAQNPSLFLAALLCVTRKLLNFKLIVDRHSSFKFDKSGSFKWKLFHAVSWFTIRNADLTVVTNAFLAGVVRDNGGRPFVLQDKLPTLTTGRASKLPNLCNAVMICGFGEDEPVLEMIEAARNLPLGWHLSITGKPSAYIQAWLKENVLPEQVEFCGFLPERDYQTLLRSADLLITLTRNEHTLNCGAYEATTLGKPMVLSNTRAIREYFNKGAEYCNPNSDSISAALLRATQNKSRLADEATLLRSELNSSWLHKFADLVDTANALIAK